MGLRVGVLLIEVPEVAVCPGEEEVPDLRLAPRCKESDKMRVKSCASSLPPRFNLSLKDILFAIFTSQLFHSEGGVLSLIVVAVQALIARIS
jgi:hypothetical protein